VDQVENRVPETEDKVEEQDQTVKEHVKMLRKYKWNMTDTWNTIKRPNLQIMGIEETKGVNKLFNEVMAENFHNLEKEKNIQL
jgi:hypothetical protein